MIPRIPFTATPPTFMTFGKYEGIEFKDIPSDYLYWVLGKKWIPAYIRTAVGEEYYQREYDDTHFYADDKVETSKETKE